MRVADLRPGWHTDFLLHRFDAQVIERDDCLVVLTRANPTFYWGNCLVVRALPRDDELGHWLARFHDEIAGPQPASRHVAIGVDADDTGQRLPAWEAAGFRIVVNHMLRARPEDLVASVRAPRGDTLLRPLDLATEGDALAEVEMTDAEGFEPAGYREYLLRQHERYRRMQDAGLLHWFGLWCDGTLAATCGLMRDHPGSGATARYQRVITHAAWRRRGLATALVHGVARFAVDRWQADALYMAADPADVAIGIYRSVGFRDLSTGVGLQRNASADGGPAAA